MSEDDRLISSEPQERGDMALRPERLADFIGQGGGRTNLETFIAAARDRGDAMDHTLLHGPPGLGKTTLAQIVSAELGVGFRATSGPVIARAGDLAALLTNLRPRDVLFIDEIHRLNPAVEEVLYPAMEDFQLDLIIGEGPSARSVRIDLPPFTLVGATTRAGLLTTPLRDRFGIQMRLQFYDRAELSVILANQAQRLGMAATIFHWGLHPWAIYAVVALALALFSYNKGLPLTLRSAFYPLLGERVWGWWGHIIDTLAVFATLFGLATSLGFGAEQTASGLTFLFGSGDAAEGTRSFMGITYGNSDESGVANNPLLLVILISAITAVALVSVVRGLDGGVKVLSEINMGLAAILLLSVSMKKASACPLKMQPLKFIRLTCRFGVTKNTLHNGFRQWKIMFFRRLAQNL